MADFRESPPRVQSANLACHPTRAGVSLGLSTMSYSSLFQGEKRRFVGIEAFRLALVCLEDLYLAGSTQNRAEIALRLSWSSVKSSLGAVVTLSTAQVRKI